MESSLRRLAAALVLLTALALGVVWWLASVFTSVANDVVSPGIVMSGSEGAQSAQSGTPAGAQSGQEGAQLSSSPDSGGAVPVGTPTPITPAPPIDLDDDDDDDDGDIDDDRDDD